MKIEKTDYSELKWAALLKLAGLRKAIKGLKSSELKRENIVRRLEEQDAVLMRGTITPIVETHTIKSDNTKVIENIKIKIKELNSLVKTLS